MRLVASALVLASCGPDPEPTPGNSASADGFGRNVRSAHYRRPPAEEKYRNCVRSGLAEMGAAQAPTVDAVRVALTACRDRLREAAIEQLRRNPAFEVGAPPENQISAVMPRIEGGLARELNPNFPVV